MSDVPIAVQAHPPERRARRSTTLCCTGCCCCCCCLHSVGAILGAGAGMPMAVAIVPKQVQSVFAWFWGAIGVVTLLTAVPTLLMGGIGEGLFTPVLAVIFGFPLIALVGGLVALIGVAIKTEVQRGRAVMAVLLLTGMSLVGAVLGTAVMFGAFALLRK